MFQLHPPRTPGACFGYSPNGVPLMPYVLTAVGDAIDIASKVQTEMDQTAFATPSGKRMRGLLYIFFGITFGAERQPSPASQEGLAVVKEVFKRVVGLYDKPISNSTKRPWFHCFENYAFFTKHLVGTDGKENVSAPLAAQTFKAKMPNGAYFPGLMYSPFGPVYYSPHWTNPTGGQCDEGGAFAFTLNVLNPGYGMTICGSAFNLPNLGFLGQPPVNTHDDSTIRKYTNTGGIITLHETFHLVSTDIIDQPRVLPPSGDYENRDWLSWTLSKTDLAYGYARSAYLGLARPQLGLLNAENYAVFSLCVQYPNLNCLGTFAAAIAKREELPFQPASEAVKRIREGGSTRPLEYGEEEWQS